MLAMQTHAAPRILAAKGCVSEPIYAPSRGVLAGDAQSVEFSRIMLYELLETMHVQHPKAAPRQYVYDLAQQAVADSQEELYKILRPAACALADGLRALELCISDKSTAYPAGTEAVHRLASAMRARGTPIRVAATVRDLGLPTGATRKRAGGMASARLKQGRARAERAAKMAGTNRKYAARLATTGALPQATWGLELGASPTVVARARRLLGAAAAPGKKRCLTTAIAVEVGSENDPAVTIRLRQLNEWRHVYTSLGPQDKKAAAKAWRGYVVSLAQPQGRWARVRGMISSTVATLYDIGWIPASPLAWIHPDRERYADARGAAADWVEIQQQISQTVVDGLWAAAVERPSAAGLDGSPDLTAPKRLIEQWTRRGETGKATVGKTVLAGGQWSGAEAAELGVKGAQAACPRCGENARETLVHRYYECAANASSGSDDVQRTQHLVHQAQREVERNPALWLRGLGTTPEAGGGDGQTLPTRVWRLEGGAFQRAAATSSGVLWCATDGSGGANSSDPRVRRVGWGAIAYVVGSDLAAIPIGAAWGGVPGRQTVARAEAHALAEALNLFGKWGFGEIRVSADASYVVGAAEKLRTGAPIDSNTDLWQAARQVWDNLQRRGVKVEVLKVRAHPERRQWQMEPGERRHQVFGNAAADTLAERAAAATAVTAVREVEVRQADQLRADIVARLVAIELEVQAADKDRKQANAEAEARLREEEQALGSPAADGSPGEGTANGGQQEPLRRR